jgi:HopA1 effector protein family
VQSELTAIWNAWQRGEARESDFYDAFWKRSEAKSGLPRPSANQYVTDLKGYGVLGDTSEEQAKQSKSGYPLTLPNKGGGTGMPKERVYVNPHPACVAPVYRFVQDRIYGLDGVIWVKVADHALAMTVRDVIVIYIAADPDPAGTVDKIRSLFAEYQGTHRAHFVNEVPRLATPLLPGVAVGAEPPTPDEFGDLFTKRLETMEPDEKEHYDYGQGYQTSFSQYRADIVKRAIMDADGDFGRYQQLVVDYLAVAGIDAVRSDIQGAAQPGIIDLLKVGYYENV